MAFVRVVTVPGRAEFFATILTLVAVVAGSGRIVSAILDSGLAAAALNLFGLSAVIWFALSAILRLGQGDTDQAALDRWDWMLGGALLLACLLPTPYPAKLALVVGGLVLFFRSGQDRPLRGISVIVLALTGPLVFGPLTLTLLGPELLNVDAAIGGALGGLEVRGNVIISPSGGIDLMIFPGCSAFTNVTLVLVLLTSLSHLLDVPIDRRIAGFAVAAAIGVILVNGIRLAALATYPQHFTYLHDGGGMILFGYASLLVMAVLVGAGILRSAKRAY
jgi:exosortase/archaeosortase family protein